MTDSIQTQLKDKMAYIWVLGTALQKKAMTVPSNRLQAPWSQWKGGKERKLAHPCW